MHMVLRERLESAGSRTVQWAERSSISPRGIMHKTPQEKGEFREA